MKGETALQDALPIRRIAYDYVLDGCPRSAIEFWILVAALGRWIALCRPRSMSGTGAGGGSITQWPEATGSKLSCAVWECIYGKEDLYASCAAVGC